MLCYSFVCYSEPTATHLQRLLWQDARHQYSVFQVAVSCSGVLRLGGGIYE